MTEALLPLLKSTFGYSSFRGMQEQVMDRVMAKQNTLVPHFEQLTSNGDNPRQAIGITQRPFSLAH